MDSNDCINENFLTPTQIATLQKTVNEKCRDCSSTQPYDPCNFESINATWTASTAELSLNFHSKAQEVSKLLSKLEQKEGEINEKNIKIAALEEIIRQYSELKYGN